MRSSPEKSRNIVFYLVLFFFFLSLIFLIKGIFNAKKIEESEVTSIPSNEVLEESEEESLKEYFDSVPLKSGEENSDLYYQETDPFREKCQDEGGTMGTRCYY